jgi:hypothetical protein
MNITKDFLTGTEKYLIQMTYNKSILNPKIFDLILTTL